jgi:hypothetical protein
MEKIRVNRSSTKKDGGLCPILNLKPLNVYIEKSHFKMETLRSIIQALHVGEWGSTLDLRDAYLQILNPRSTRSCIV